MLPTLRGFHAQPAQPHAPYRLTGSRPKRLRSAKWVVLMVLVALACGCEKSSQEQLAAARDSLANGSYADAVSAAEGGLAGSPSKADAWGFELVLLEAYARGGDGENAKAQLVKLAGLYPSQLSANDYSGTAQQLQAAGQGPGAIEVLDLGKQRYPDDPMIDKMIAESVAAESSPEELEMLRSLGYIE
jgi:hypothetical protein